MSLVRQVFTNGVYFTLWKDRDGYYADWATPNGVRKGQYSGAGNVKLQKEKYLKIHDEYQRFSKKQDKEFDDSLRDSGLTGQEFRDFADELDKRQKQEMKDFLKKQVEG